MGHPALTYLENIGEEYLPTTRKLVRSYDDMVNCVIEQVLETQARSILDIGCGPADIDEQILLQDQNCHITCLDGNERMVEAAKKKLAPYLAANRAKLIKANALDFDNSGRYDLILSNLVFKFFEQSLKETILKKIYEWLKEEGTFIWGDRITFKDKRIVEAINKRRKKFALTNGMDKELLRLFLAREVKTDHPFTTEQTMELAHKCGFTPTIIWLKDNMAIFLLKK